MQRQVFASECKGKHGVTAKDITPEMFNKETGHLVEECKLRVVYISPLKPPSPVPEGSEEGSSPRGSVLENGNLNGNEFRSSARAFGEQLDSQKTVEAMSLISKLTAEKNNAIQQNNKLRQELELLRREGNQNHGGVSFMFVIFVSLLGLFLGYLVKRT